MRKPKPPKLSPQEIKKALQETIDEFPEFIKRKERAAKERARIIKAFRSVEHKLFPKKKNQA